MELIALLQRSIDRKVIGGLDARSFTQRTHNVVLLGPPGVGKTHLAIGLGITAGPDTRC